MSETAKQGFMIGYFPLMWTDLKDTLVSPVISNVNEAIEFGRNAVNKYPQIGCRAAYWGLDDDGKTPMLVFVMEAHATKLGGDIFGWSEGHPDRFLSLCTLQGKNIYEATLLPNFTMSIERYKKNISEAQKRGLVSQDVFTPDSWQILFIPPVSFRSDKPFSYPINLDGLVRIGLMNMEDITPEIMSGEELPDEEFIYDLGIFPSYTEIVNKNIKPNESFNMIGIETRREE